MAEQKLTERGVLQSIKDTYNPFYNLYTKKQLEEKVNCFKLHNSDPQKYYGCIRAIDEGLLKDSDFLRQQFAKVDIQIADQKKTCALEHKDYPDKLEQCNNRALHRMDTDARSIYDNFYKRKIGNRPEFRKL